MILGVISRDTSSWAARLCLVVSSRRISRFTQSHLDTTRANRENLCGRIRPAQQLEPFSSFLFSFLTANSYEDKALGTRSGLKASSFVPWASRLVSGLGFLKSLS